jgi:chromosome segregation ATPase
MPDSIDLHIKSIQPKLQLLLKKFALLGKENLQIKNENENYKLREKELVAKIETLEQQVNILKASAGTLEGDERVRFEKNINQYIRNIDKCIAMLNK